MHLWDFFMANANLKHAKKQKNDEFYTQYQDIQKEVNAYLEYDKEVFRGKTILLPCDDPEWSNFTKFFAQNFENFGIKKLISTSFAVESKNIEIDYEPSLFESIDPRFDKTKTRCKGKIFTLAQDENHDGKINIDDLKWNYLEGDGDFRSDEVKKLRDEADIIITNPPFSLFREYVDVLFAFNKKFIIIGNNNAITYKEFFPHIKNGEVWLGRTLFTGTMPFFIIPKDFEVTNDRVIEEIEDYKEIKEKKRYYDLRVAVDENDKLIEENGMRILGIVIEGTDWNGHREMINLPLSEENYIKIYNQAKKYWDKGDLSKYVICFMNNDDRCFQYTRPDKNNFEKMVDYNQLISKTELDVCEEYCNKNFTLLETTNGLKRRYEIK